jgi:HD superfamily phosphodiesterase
MKNRGSRNTSTRIIVCNATFAVLALLGAAAQLAAETPAGPAPPPDWHAVVRELAVKNFKNPAWGYSHCERDYALARALAAADHVALDEDILYAAAFLHDMAAFAPWEKQQVDHSDEAARIVDGVLQGTGFPMQKIDAVRGAIRTHMYYRDPAASPEALYLHDADALDWLGAIGIARIMALVDPNGGDPTGPDAVKTLEDNLAKVPSRVFSPAGRALVAPRSAELRRFLSELRRESDDLATL